MESTSVESTQPEQPFNSTLVYVYGVFVVLIILLVCANTRSRRTMMNFLHSLGISLKRSPRVIKELKRKGFHFSGLIIPFIYIMGLHTGLMDQFSGSLIMIGVSLLYFIMECARLLSPQVNNLFGQLFKGLMREKERHNFTGSFFYLVGATISIVFFRYVNSYALIISFITNK